MRGRTMRSPLMFILVHAAILCLLLSSTGRVITCAEEAEAQQCSNPATCSSDASSQISERKKDESFNEEALDSSGEASKSSSTKEQPKVSANGDRLITPEELAEHDGEGGASPTNPIWIAVLGEVYDVTPGEGYYGVNAGGYHLFAGRDASPCFATGNFTKEGALQPIDGLDDNALKAILDWAIFYQQHEKYKFLGLLAGGMFYDEEGIETPLRKDVVSRASKAKAEWDAKQAEKNKAREERRRKKQLEREQKKAFS